ncbi:MAG: stage II sporulation protein M [Deltaproteobacteria bacterium]|nr:stage II sporulation protein M [Deltaproteobacteria bacterium]MCL4874377.1 stage II sporulation protein M [bacterium]
MEFNATLAKSLGAAGKLRNLIVFYAAVHLIFLFFGQWMVAQGYPGVIELREEQLKEIQELPYLKPLTGALAENLPLKILYTFSFNLVFGAFLSTTFTGLVFFLPYIVAVWRGFIIGILIAGMNADSTMLIVFYGTFVLEFGAYCLSSSVGTDLGLSLIWPDRKGTSSRKDALLTAGRNGVRLYVLIIIILFMAAIWEMTLLHYLRPITGPVAS